MQSLYMFIKLNGDLVKVEELAPKYNKPIIYVRFNNLKSNIPKSKQLFRSATKRDVKQNYLSIHFLCLIFNILPFVST